MATVLYSILEQTSSFSENQLIYICRYCISRTPPNTFESVIFAVSSDWICVHSSCWWAQYSKPCALTSWVYEAPYSAWTLINNNWILVTTWWIHHPSVSSQITTACGISIIITRTQEYKCFILPEYDCWYLNCNLEPDSKVLILTLSNRMSCWNWCFGLQSFENSQLFHLLGMYVRQNPPGKEMEVASMILFVNNIERNIMHLILVVFVICIWKNSDIVTSITA